MLYFTYSICCLSYWTYWEFRMLLSQIVWIILDLLHVSLIRDTNNVNTIITVFLICTKKYCVRSKYQPSLQNRCDEQEHYSQCRLKKFSFGNFFTCSHSKYNIFTVRTGEKIAKGELHCFNFHEIPVWNGWR